MSEKSLGLVETQFYKLENELTLKSGIKLESITLAFETYGELNKDKSNAILSHQVRKRFLIKTHRHSNGAPRKAPAQPRRRDFWPCAAGGTKAGWLGTQWPPWRT